MTSGFVGVVSYRVNWAVRGERWSEEEIEFAPQCRQFRLNDIPDDFQIPNNRILCFEIEKEFRVLHFPAVHFYASNRLQHVLEQRQVRAASHKPEICGYSLRFQEHEC